MVNRSRPRLTLTVNSDLKKQLKRAAVRLDLPVSRLVELLVRDFLTEYSKNPELESNIKRKVEEMKKSPGEINKEKSKKEVRRILDEFDSID